MKRILFSENESFYRELGLVNVSEFIFEFDGMRHYKKGGKFLNQYDGFVCAFYSLPHNFLLSLKFNSLGLKTILVSDGVFDFANSFYNEMHARYGYKLYFPVVQNYFLSSDKAGGNYVGSFNKHSNIVGYRPSRMIESMLMDMPEGTHILITTANQSYFDDIEFTRLVSLISDIVNTLTERGIRFSFRIFDSKLYSSLISINPVFRGFRNDIENKFEECLMNYSHVITTPSSISITSMYHKRAVMTLVYRTTPLSIQSAWNIFDSNVFNLELDNFLSFDSCRIEQQEILLNYYLEEKSISEALVFAIECESTAPDKFYYNEILKTSFYRMMNSKFNFNIEYLIRKCYLHVKKNVFVKFLRKHIKW